jgi:stage IV sporulation protein FB
MLVDGYFRVGRLAGVDLRLHWSVPVGALVFGSLRFEPLLWLAFLAVIGVHELGHALLIKAVLSPAEGNRITGIDVTGYGGQCRFRGRADALEHALIAWGGVLAQAVLLIGTLLIVSTFGHATSHTGSLVEHAFIEINLWIAGINLLPFAPLDGARAWRVFPELGSRGWTLARLVIYPLWRWAERRRRGRVEPAGPSSLEPSSSVEGSTPLRRARPVPAVSAAADAERASADDDLIEKPSAQAQRELAALLERIGDEAGRAKKRR